MVVYPYFVVSRLSRTDITTSFVISVCLLCLAAHIPCLNAECPNDVIVQAQQCLAGIVNRQGGGSKSGTLIDLNDLSSFCKEGRLQRMVECVGTLVSECEGSELMTYLSLMVNVRQMRTGVQQLCTKVTLLETSAPCFEEHANHLTHCARSEATQLEASINEHRQNLTAMLIIQCRFMSQMIECHRGRIAEECGQEIADTYANFMLAFVPESCGVASKEQFALDRTTESTEDPKQSYKTDGSRLENTTADRDKSNSPSTGSKIYTFAIYIYILVLLVTSLTYL